MSVDPRFIASMLTNDPSVIRTPRILSEADLPPPTPQAMVRSADQGNANAAALFKTALADGVKRNPGDIAKAIRYVTAYQTDNLDNPAEFIKLLENLAAKNNVDLSDLKDSSAYRGARSHASSASAQATKPSSNQGLQVNFPGDPNKFKGGAAYANYKTGNPKFDQALKFALDRRNGNIKDAVTMDLLNHQPSEQDKAAFVTSLKQVAKKVGLGDLQLPSTLQVAENVIDPRMIASMLTEDPSVFVENFPWHMNDPDFIYEDKDHRCYKTFKIGDVTVEVCIYFNDSRKGVSVTEWEVCDCSLPRGPECDMAMKKVEDAINSGEIDIEEICEEHCSQCAGDC